MKIDCSMRQKRKGARMYIGRWSCIICAVFLALVGVMKVQEKGRGMVMGQGYQKGYPVYSLRETSYENEYIVQVGESFENANVIKASSSNAEVATVSCTEKERGEGQTVFVNLQNTGITTLLLHIRSGYQNYIIKSKLIVEWSQELGTRFQLVGKGTTSSEDSMMSATKGREGIKIKVRCIASQWKL